MPSSKSQNDSLTLLKLMHHVGQSMARNVSDVLDEFSLSESQVAMLWALEPSTPPISMRQLAEKLNYDPSNITLISHRLEEAGLIERQPHSTDGRQRVLALTKKGRHVWSAIIDRLRDRSPVFLLSKQEQAQLCGLLAKVYEHNA